jgi:hypothetical protein
MCPVRCIVDVPAYLKEKCKPDTSRITSVPKIKPMTRTEYEEWGREWPTMFRPNASDKERERGFNAVEMAQHSYFMSKVEIDSKDVSVHCATAGGTANGLNLDVALEGGGIVVNPQNGMVCFQFYFSFMLKMRSAITLHLRLLLTIFRFDFSGAWCVREIIQVVMTSYRSMLHEIDKRGLRSITNPLLNTTMICIEGTAAIVRGEIENRGIVAFVDNFIILYAPNAGRLPDIFCAVNFSWQNK